MQKWFPILNKLTWADAKKHFSEEFISKYDAADDKKADDLIIAYDYEASSSMIKCASKFNC